MELNNLNKLKIIFMGLFIILLIVAVYSQQGPFVGTNSPTGQYHHISEIWIDTPYIDWRGLEFINISKLFVNQIDASQICLGRRCMISFEDYTYIRPIIITEMSGNPLINYQVLITLNTRTLISQGKMRSDCGDIRFTDSDGLTLLNYWIESNTCNTANTRIWVKVPIIPANSQKIIYLFYGNPSATSTSNASSTFIAYDLRFDGPIGGRTSVGVWHTCALLSNGSIACWGWNNYGQLGDGTTTDKYTPVLVQGINNAVAISTGRWHTCALLSNGSIACWGYNNYGQLGNGTFGGYSTTPVLVQNINNAVAISTGDSHTCALLSNRSIACWGYNNYGQLGDGTTTNKNTPVLVQNINNAVAIAAGWGHTCALLSNGSIACWGNNYNGQLGDGTTTSKSTPVLVRNINNAVAIATGGAHTCALLSNGSIACWGNNYYGQLGDGTTTNRASPVLVRNINNAVAISAGGAHTCALLSNGSIACWGINGAGQLGDGTNTTRLTPVLVQNINNAVAISTGDSHTCALLSNGSIACWGWNYYGQLGDGTTTDKYTPVLVLNYNLGGRYDKTGGILTLQRSPLFYDWYFIRKYSPIEPLVSLGDEEKI
ncbi:MAG: DUF2341 domain-containing protein [Nanopusillaceae archaeon]